MQALLRCPPVCVVAWLGGCTCVQEESCVWRGPVFTAVCARHSWCCSRVCVWCSSSCGRGSSPWLPTSPTCCQQVILGSGTIITSSPQTMYPPVCVHLLSVGQMGFAPMQRARKHPGTAMCRLYDLIQDQRSRKAATRSSASPRYLSTYTWPSASTLSCRCGLPPCV